jgi:hypothetical protein
MAKTLNALIYPSAPTVIADRRMIDVATIPQHKAPWWRPVVVVGDDAFDPLTQKKTGPVTTIEDNQVVDTYSVVALTAQEIIDLKDAAVSSINGNGFAPVLKMLFNLNNRVRVLEGQAAITMAQFKAAIKAAL